MEGLSIKSRNAGADTRFYLDDQNLHEEGTFDCRIEFHKEELSSLMMIPDKPGKALQMSVYLTEEIRLHQKQWRQWIPSRNQPEQIWVQDGNLNRGQLGQSGIERSRSP